MRTVIIDCDSLVYAAARANEHEIQWSPDLWTLHAHLEPSIEHLDNDVEEIRQNLEADRVVMALSDYENPWRKQIMPTYKSNRKDVRKPVCYRPLREYVHEKYETFQRPGLEGDDTIGILMTNPVLIDGEKVCVSLDKDMKTIPGLHVNLKKAQDEGHWFPLSISKHTANYYHMLQAVMGDATDGYPGCPGIGRKTAEKLLDPFCHFPDETFDVIGAWQAIVAAYKKKGLSEDVALLNARVARICRHTDYDYKEKKVKLWNPPEKISQ